MAEFIGNLSLLPTAGWPTIATRAEDQGRASAMRRWNNLEAAIAPVSERYLTAATVRLRQHRRGVGAKGGFWYAYS
jgi:hypothetical protein